MSLIILIVHLKCALRIAHLRNYLILVTTRHSPAKAASVPSNYDYQRIPQPFHFIRLRVERSSIALSIPHSKWHVGMIARRRNFNEPPFSSALVYPFQARFKIDFAILSVP